MQGEPPYEAGTFGKTGPWPVHRTSLLDWLMVEARDERLIDNIFVELYQRLREAGIPIARATLNFQIQHP